MATLREIIPLIKEFRLDEAEVKLVQAHKEYAESNNTKFSIMCNSMLAFVKGEQHKTLEKKNIHDYLVVRYTDSLIMNLELATEELDNDPVCVIMLANMLLAKGQNVQALNTLNTIANIKSDDKFHVHVMLKLADTITLLSDNQLECLPMYANVCVKARSLDYPRAVAVTQLRMGSIAGAARTVMLDKSEKLLMEAHMFFNIVHDVYMLTFCNMNLGMVCYHTRKYSMAEKYTQMAIDMFRDQGVPSTSTHIQQCICILASIYKNQNKRSVAYMMFVDLIQAKILPQHMLEHCQSMVMEYAAHKK